MNDLLRNVYSEYPFSNCIFKEENRDKWQTVKEGTNIDSFEFGVQGHLFYEIIEGRRI